MKPCITLDELVEQLLNAPSVNALGNAQGTEASGLFTDGETSPVEKCQQIYGNVRVYLFIHV
jgi:hypothetical protein